MARSALGSLTKEPPLSTLDATIAAIVPGMAYDALLAVARRDPKMHRDAPGLISKRFLLVEADGSISYDHFLSLTKVNSLSSPFIRKVMYFLWAYRDERIRRFICEKIADKSGKWRASQLVNKGNGIFFEQWLQPNTAKKARSNFEFFLVETGIFDKDTSAVHLELDDGWLEQAAITAAQHEDDPVAREQLLANPFEFLKGRNWLGLLNFSGVAPRAASPMLTVDASPLEDDAITTSPTGSWDSRDWNRPPPTTSGRTRTTLNIDLVKRERANKSHFSLEKSLAGLAKEQDFTPRYNQNIDLYFETPHGTVLAEIKSCTDSNFHAQIRKGISQLFEYRFVFRKLLSSETTMLLVVETTPPKEKRWLIEYVSSLGVILAWRDQVTGEIVTKSKLPPSLKKIVRVAL